MSTGAVVMLIVSWTFVLGLMFWSFWRIIHSKDHFDPDGIGPDSPPVPGRADPKSARRPKR